MSAEAFRLPLHLLRQLVAANAVRKARVIVDLLGQRHLSARGEPFDHQRLKSRPGRIQRRGIAAGAAADDDRIIQAFCGLLLRLGQNTRQKRLDSGLGFRSDDGAGRLAVHVQPERRN